MNTTKMLGVALPLFGCLISGHAAADILDGLGYWEGSGTAYEVSGRDLGTFSVSLVRRSIGQRKVRSEGKVILASGQEVVFWQELEDHGPNGFSLMSSNGSGGGKCFANGICESFEWRADGHAFATSVVADGADKVRIVVTELEQGRAVRFFQQTLLKKP